MIWLTVLATLKPEDAEPSAESNELKSTVGNVLMTLRNALYCYLAQDFLVWTRSGGARSLHHQGGYCNSFSTDCCIWLDCCSAAIPVCCKMLYFERLATCWPISAALMPSSALDRFWIWMAMTFEALCRRFDTAPRLPRSEAMFEIALEIAVKADCASAAVLRSFVVRLTGVPVNPRLAEDRLPIVMVIGLLPAPVPSLR